MTGDIEQTPEPAPAAGPETGRRPRLPAAARLHNRVMYLRDKAMPYHRHLSALATLAGFIGDNYFFRHADAVEMQFLFIVYLATIAASLLFLHAIEVRTPPETWKRWRMILPLATQFSFGGLWSALLIFYAHAAVFTAAWPFLLLLVATLIGTEVFSRHIARLVWSSVLLFFGLFSSAIFLVPLYVGAMGAWVFILSGLVAVILFTFYLRLLKFAGGGAYLSRRWQILSGVAGVLVILNTMYFTAFLPPLPLVLRDSGIYHAIRKAGDIYETKGEKRQWYESWLGRSNVQHVKEGGRLYAYSAVFTPVALTTRIVHRWQYYSESEKRWLPRGAVSFGIRGGREGGYRGYSRKTDPKPGEWRVDIGTGEGRLIGRVRFTVERVKDTPRLVEKDLR